MPPGDRTGRSIGKRSATCRRSSNASVCSGSSRSWCLWENTTNEEVLKRARDEVWQGWRRALRRPRRSPRVPRNCSTATRCPHSTIRSLAAAPCRSKQRLGLEAHATRAASLAEQAALRRWRPCRADSSVSRSVGPRRPRLLCSASAATRRPSSVHAGVQATLPCRLRPSG